MPDPLDPVGLTEAERLHMTNLREAWRIAAPVYTDLAATDVEWLCTIIDRLSAAPEPAAEAKIEGEAPTRKDGDDEATSEEPPPRAPRAEREALERIADGQQCEKVVKTASPSGWCRNRPDQTIDAPYTADRWCNTCIARDALAAPAPAEPREGESVGPITLAQSLNMVAPGKEIPPIVFDVCERIVAKYRLVPTDAPEGGARVIRTCDVCFDVGEVRIDGDAYVCTRCDAEQEAAIAAAAEAVGVDVQVATAIVDAFFAHLDPEEG